MLNFLKGGPISCTRMSMRTAPAALAQINAAMEEEPAGTFGSPVSCASLMLRRAGLSGRLATLAAGFAGGVGLSA